ncbi:hypothetical protein CDD80_4850 [Ophiocordyceps camponoti-rufipedis]|uniref:CCAAT-binding factor domain-containing protein n=1 Tax=Ophiocordyceps camponoti-rufipedis TaxID=2004952 RepID=A0A2C5YY74_9HYPO|nr:hypothetical protein CDD80_4850 [Ophiocordyceps camponoti-rufipedis]
MSAVAMEDGSKRKRASTEQKPVKRRRSSTGDDEADDGARILAMEQGILESRKNYNDISLLLRTAEGHTEESMLATVALCRVFLRLLAQGSLTFKKPPSEKGSVVVSWLRDRLLQYKELLLLRLADEDLAVTALTLCMRIFKAEGQFLSGKEAVFPAAFLEDVLERVLVVEGGDVRRAFVEDFVEQFDDVRFYTFKTLTERMDSKQLPSGVLFDRVFSLISSLDGVPASAEDLTDFYVPQPLKKTHPVRLVSHHKRAGQHAWLSLLDMIETKEQRKRILTIMSTVIAPWFPRPELLSDFLTNSYNAGGSLSLLALSGVFYLIKERNLDYPSFYPRLYSLLDRNVLHSKHRSRFFRLLDTFLASTHLPAALVASFIKRLARLALNAPASAIAFVMPWIYNLFRRHPTCTFMIHRVIRDADMKRKILESGFDDPFLADETNPMETKAIDSCLWEMVQLQSHYQPNVATICNIVSEQFTKQSYNMEDFLDHTYASLLEAEMAKQVKKPPVVEFQIPKRIFLPHDAAAEVKDSLLVRLIDFGDGVGKA